MDPIAMVQAAYGYFPHVSYNRHPLGVCRVITWDVDRAPDDSDDPVTVSGHCVRTGEVVTFQVPMQGLVKWFKGDLIQNALPELEVWKREFLICSVGPNSMNN